LPLALFGHSMGAIVAFELARALGRDVVHLIASGSAGPSLPRGGRGLHQLPHDELVAELERLGGTPEEVLQNRELLDLLVPRLRADLTASETYRRRPAPLLACPITVLGGRDDRAVSGASLAAWADETTGGFAQHMLAGDHFFVSTRRAEVLGLIGRALGS
jgi:surfactin synthase thioesterase subunit